ncbi:MAG: TolC family protein [Planctomycetota bacterium]
MRRTPSAAWATLACLTLASCNLWPGGLGHVELPYHATESRSMPRRSLELDAATAQRSIEEGLEALRERAPTPADEAPAAVRSTADQRRPLSIEAMRLMVLQNNLDLEVALFEPEIARTRVSAEEGRFDALIGSKFAYRRKATPRLDGPLVDLSSDDPALDSRVVKLTELDQRQELLDLGVDLTVPLPTGGVVKLGSLFDEKTIVGPQRFEQYLAATRLSISQPLLRNAGQGAALASIRLARVGERRAEVRTKLAAMRILAAAEKAYWRLYAARRLLDIRAEQHRLAAANLDLVQRRVAEGITARVEIARSEVGLYQRLEALIVAETSWRLRQRRLKAYLATEQLPLRGPEVIDVATEPLLAGLQLDADLLVDRALAERLELIDMELAIVRNGIALQLRENQVLPIVNLDFQYGLLERDNGLGQAWAGQWDLDHQDVWVGLSMEVPFTNQRRRAQLEGALFDRARALASKRAQELTVRREVLDMVDVVERNWQRIVAARQNAIVAGVNYDAERRQFEQGLRTMREVLEALGDLGDAQTREVKAIVDYQVAQIDLAFATGTLLGYSRVDLAPLAVPRLDEP